MCITANDRGSLLDDAYVESTPHLRVNVLGQLKAPQLSLPAAYKTIWELKSSLTHQ